MARKRQALMFISRNVHRKAALDSRTSQFSFQNPAKTLCLHHHIADFRPFLRKSAFIFIPLWSDADNSFKEKSPTIRLIPDDGIGGKRFQVRQDRRFIV